MRKKNNNVMKKYAAGWFSETDGGLMNMGLFGIFIPIIVDNGYNKVI